jgi:hypothetical protein
MRHNIEDNIGLVVHSVDRMQGRVQHNMDLVADSMDEGLRQGLIQGRAVAGELSLELSQAASCSWDRCKMYLASACDPSLWLRALPDRIVSACLSSSLQEQYRISSDDHDKLCRQSVVYRLASYLL